METTHTRKVVPVNVRDEYWSFGEESMKIEYVYNEGALKQLSAIATFNFSINVKLKDPSVKQSVPNDIWMGPLFWKKLKNEDIGRKNSSMCKISSQTKLKPEYLSDCWPESLEMQMIPKRVLNYICEYIY